MAALVAGGLPPGHSAIFNVAWSMQYADAFSWAYPLPRYLPGLWDGMGGQDFFFYAPLPFWVGSALIQPLCPSCSPVTALIVAAALFLVGSGWAMYAFLRELFAPLPAAAGAIIYTILPYHLLIDWFARQALGEFAAYAFLPLIALGVERWRQNRGGGPFVIFGVAGLCLSHLPTALLAAHIFAVVCLAFLSTEKGGLATRLRRFAALAVYAASGLALSAFYWLPAVSLVNTVSSGVLFSDYFAAWRWLYGPAGSPPNARFALAILMSFLATAPLLLAALLLVRGAKLQWIAIPAVCAIVLNLWFTAPLWQNWIIANVQFPWRLMSFVDLATAIAFAALVASATTRNCLTRVAIAAALAALPVIWLVPQTVAIQPASVVAERYSSWMGAIEYLSPQMTEAVAVRLNKDEGIIHFDQLAVIDAMVGLSGELRASEGAAQIIRKSPREVTVTADATAERIMLPIQYWQYWQAETADGERLPIIPNLSFGTLQIDAPAGGFSPAPITVTLPLHWSEKAGFALSGFVVLLLAFGIKRKP